MCGLFLQAVDLNESVCTSHEWSVSHHSLLTSLSLSFPHSLSSTLNPSTFLFPLFIHRFELTVSVYLLYQLLGWSLLAGLTVFAILVPIQAKMAGVMNRFQDEKLKWMDSRLRLMTEILTNIKIVKLYNWYVFFSSRLLGLVDE